jgi:hypothetical protein
MQSARCKESAMNSMTSLTNKEAYEARNDDGRIYGTIGPRVWNRFRQSLRCVPKDIESLLDCGCDRGHWLSYVLDHRNIKEHLGVDISEARVEEARSLYPNVNFAAGYLENLGLEPCSFDVVTCMEVLEHIPQWQNVFENLLTWAKMRVFITVPYREVITKTICAYCGKLTPMYGHLHVFSEQSFPDIPGWRRSYGYLKDYGIGSRQILYRLYRRLIPRRAWLAVMYDREPLTEVAR